MFERESEFIPLLDYEDADRLNAYGLTVDQVRNAALQPELRATAKRAIDAIRRGVVAVDAG